MRLTDDVTAAVTVVWMSENSLVHSGSSPTNVAWLLRTQTQPVCVCVGERVSVPPSAFKFHFAGVDCRLMCCLLTVLRPSCLFMRGQFCPTPLAQIITFANEGPAATALCKCLSDERHKETAGAALASQGLRLKTRKSGRPCLSILPSLLWLCLHFFFTFATTQNFPIRNIFRGRQIPARVLPNAVVLCTKML